MRISDETKIMRKDDFEKYVNFENFKIYSTRENEAIYVNTRATIIRVKAVDDMRIIETISKNDANENKKFTKFFNSFGRIEKVCIAVAKLFLDKPIDGFYELQHIDGNIRNDDVNNLCWQLRSERIHQYWQSKIAVDEKK